MYEREITRNSTCIINGTTWHLYSWWKIFHYCQSPVIIRTWGFSTQSEKSNKFLFWCSVFKLQLTSIRFWFGYKDLGKKQLIIEWLFQAWGLEDLILTTLCVQECSRLIKGKILKVRLLFRQDILHFLHRDLSQYWNIIYTWLIFTCAMF